MASHYLTLPRAIIYQATTLVAMVAGAVASYALKTYTNDRNLAASYGASLSTTEISAAGGLVIASGALAGTACGLLFLAIMLRPGHGENKKSAVIKETSLAVLTVLSLAASIFATVAIVKGSATLSTEGLTTANYEKLMAALGSLKYSSSAPTIVYLVFSWLTTIALAASTIICSLAARRVLRDGAVVGVEPTWTEKKFDHLLAMRKRGGGSQAERGLVETDSV